MKVNLMTAPAAIGAVTYPDTAEVEAECALVRDTPFVETFMTAASPGIVASAMDNRHYATVAEYVHAIADALQTEYRVITDRGLLLQIDAPDLAMERHTLLRRPAARRVPRVGRARRREHQPRAHRHRSGPSAPARVLGQLRGSAHARRPARRDPRDPLRRARRRARDLDGERPPRARARVLRPRAAPRPHGADRRASSTRRATTWSTPRSSPIGSSGSPRPSATRAGSSPAPIAGSTRRPASATSRRRSCGRSSARCARAPTSRPTRLF